MTWLLQISSVVLLLFFFISLRKKLSRHLKHSPKIGDPLSVFFSFYILSLFPWPRLFLAEALGLHSLHPPTICDQEKIPFEALMGLRLLKFTLQLSAPKSGFLAEQIRICCDSISGKLRLFFLERLKLNGVNKFQLCLCCCFHISSERSHLTSSQLLAWYKKLIA